MTLNAHAPGDTARLGEGGAVTRRVDPPPPLVEWGRELGLRFDEGRSARDGYRGDSIIPLCHWLSSGIGDVVHEVAHYQCATPDRRLLFDFGLGAGPDTRSRDSRVRAHADWTLTVIDTCSEEASASLLGLLIERHLDVGDWKRTWKEHAWADNSSRSIRPSIDRLRKWGLVDPRRWTIPLPRLRQEEV